MEKKKIKVTKEIRKSLMADFKLRYETLGNYLNFFRNSKEAEMVREAALQRGGKLVVLKETEVSTAPRPVKMLDSKGNIIAQRTV